MPSNDHLWGIILAGGEGRRLQDFIRVRYGVGRPKQYSAIIGKRSMLRHTIDRVEKVISARQLRIVVSKNHRKYLPEVPRKKNKSLF